MHGPKEALNQNGKNTSNDMILAVTARVSLIAASSLKAGGK